MRLYLLIHADQNHVSSQSSAEDKCIATKQWPRKPTIINRLSLIYLLTDFLVKSMPIKNDTK